MRCLIATLLLLTSTVACADAFTVPEYVQDPLYVEIRSAYLKEGKVTGALPGFDVTNITQVACAGATDRLRGKYAPVTVTAIIHGSTARQRLAIAWDVDDTAYIANPSRLTTKLHPNELGDVAVSILVENNAGTSASDEVTLSLWRGASAQACR